jgi:DNA-binding NarL/FixJ family response regulator
MKILIVSDHPIVAESLSSLLERRIPGALAACCNSLEAVFREQAGGGADVVVADSEALASLGDLRELLRLGGPAPLVLWGVPSHEFAVQAVYSGVKAVVSKREGPEVLAEAVRSVREGRRWFDQEVLDACLTARPITLTPREGQLVSLIAQGLRNKEAAEVMGTTEGTVKVYVSRLFKRLNVSDRLPRNPPWNPRRSGYRPQG